MPELVTVTLCGALVVPCVVGLNEMEDGAIKMAGRVTGGPVPAPLSSTDCGEFGASSAILMEAVRRPAARGAKVTAIEQVAFGG